MMCKVEVSKTQVLEKSLLTQYELFVLVVIEFGIHESSFSVVQVHSSINRTHSKENLPFSEVFTGM